MISNEEYQIQVNIIRRHTDEQFIKLHLAHLRYFEGDGTPAILLAYIFNLFVMKNSNKREVKELKENDMFFRCPAKNIQYKLGMGDEKQRRGIKVLIDKKLVETQRRKGNNLWIKINTETLEKIDLYEEISDEDIGDGGSWEPQKPGNPETGEPRIQKPGFPGSHVNMNIKKHIKENCLDTEPTAQEQTIKNNKSSVPEKFMFKWASDLHQILKESKKKKLFDKFDSYQWAKSFESLYKRCSDDRIRIDSVLSWLKHNIDKFDEPSIENARKFCSNCIFNWIESMMNKGKKKEIKEVELIPRVQEVVNELLKESWPKGSSIKLPKVVQESYKNYKEFRYKVRQIYSRTELENSTKTSERNLYNLVDLLLKRLTPPKEFILGWFKEYNTNVSNWSNWSGTIPVLNLENQDFVKVMISIIEEVLHDTSIGLQRWNMLVKEIHQI